MEVQLPADQQAMVEGLVAAGRFSTVDDAISEALRLLNSAEKLKQEVKLGIDQADAEQLLDHDTVFGRLKIMAENARSGH